MMINGIWAQMRGLGAAVWGGGVRWVWMLCLLWGSVGHAVPVQVVHEAGQWRSYWHQLSEDKNVGGVLWRVQQGFEIREDFKIAPESYWEVASGQTVSWRNQLLNQLSERSYLFKSGFGRLSVFSEGQFNGDWHVLEGALHFGRAGVFGGVADSGVHLYPGTRLEYDPGVLMWGRLYMHEQRPQWCGRWQCALESPQLFDEQGVQWVVRQGVATQRGVVFGDIPIYKLGAGVLHWQGIDVGPALRGPVHVLEGGLWVNTATGAPIHVYQGAWVRAWGADLGQLYVRSGGRVQVWRDSDGPGLRVGFNLGMAPGALMVLERGAERPELAVIEARRGAQLHLDGHVLVSLQGQGWDPRQRYALIKADQYHGRFADYEIQGAVPAEYRGVLEYDAQGLWLEFVPLSAGRLQPDRWLPDAAQRHSIVLKSSYFPQSVAQFYQLYEPRVAGLSGWVWSGGARQRLSTGAGSSVLNDGMHYLGLNWQSAAADPVNIGLQVGFERGNWYAGQHKTQIDSWIGGLSLQQQHRTGWGWLLGVSRHQYRLQGLRGLEAQYDYRAHLTQFYGQLSYDQYFAQTAESHWRLTPLVRVRWMRLHRPAYQSYSAQTHSAASVASSTDQLKEWAVGVRAQWSKESGHQRTRWYLEAKQHWWAGSTQLRAAYTEGGQTRLSSQHSTIRPYWSLQLGLQHHPHPHWSIHAGMQTRLGPGRRENALQLNIEGVF